MTSRKFGRRGASTILATLLLASASPAFAQDDVPSVRAQRASVPPKIDGTVDDEVWGIAESAGNFTQQFPDDGQPETMPTRFQVAYDNANLYIIMIASDPEPDKIADRIHRRDQDSASDWLGVTIDGYHDHRTGRFFWVNAGGIQQDGNFSADGRSDTTWDGVWESAVKINDEGWIAEFRIPLNALRFQGDGDGTWGLQVTRFVARSSEETYWSPRSQSDNRYVSLAGHLTGMDMGEPPLRLSLLPYATGVANANIDPEGTFSKDSDIRAGLDLRYGITPQMTLDATILPDFGQVEVDDLQINLGAFELFFPEKRPFFTEGAGVFETELNLNDGGNTNFFYSRRIGAGNANILSAAKLTGRNDKGLSVGIIEAVTEEVTETYTDDSGQDVEEVINPTTNYGVARIRQDIGDHSAVGGMVTAVNRAGDQSHDAYAVMADAVVADPTGVYTLEAMAGATALTQDGETQTGTTGSIALNKGSGDKFVTSGVYGFTTQDFQVNDLGFATQVNQHGGWLWGQYRKLDGFGPFRAFRWNHNISSATIIDPKALRFANYNGNIWIQRQNFAGFAAGYGVAANGHNPYEPRLGGFDLMYNTPREAWAWVDYWSDWRKPASFGLSFNSSGDAFGGRRYRVSPWVQLRVGKRAEFNLSAAAATTSGEIGWADYHDSTGDGLIDSSIFGRRDYIEADISHQGMVAFTKNLSLQYFAQFLLIQGQYSEYFLLEDNGDLASDGFYYIPDGTADSRLSFQYFQGNARLRWQYRPGSEIFFVWTHERYGGMVEEDDLATVLAQPFSNGHNNTFALKATYRWGAEDARRNFRLAKLFRPERVAQKG